MKAKEFILNNGMKLPPISPGTYRLNRRERVETIQRVVEIGYRLLDSAFNYENEGAIGEAIRISCAPRGEPIVTSKLPGHHQEHMEALLTIEESLYRGGLDYYNIYLIH